MTTTNKVGYTTYNWTSVPYGKKGVYVDPKVRYFIGRNKKNTGCDKKS